MTEDERIAKLTQKMLRRKLYIVVSKSLAGPERMKPYLASHLEYMIALERRGMVFASGPLADPGAAPRGDGMTILRAADAEEASKIAQADPFFVNGLRTFHIREWTLMEGSFGLKVSFSDQIVEVA